MCGCTQEKIGITGHSTSSRNEQFLQPVSAGIRITIKKLPSLINTRSLTTQARAINEKDWWGELGPSSEMQGDNMMNMRILSSNFSKLFL
jgi:hypothetical protein